MNLIEFLNARLDEREAEANEIHRPAVCRSIDRDGEFDPDPIWCSCDYPARVLRDVEADRKLLAAYAEVAYMDCDDPEPEYAYGRAKGLGEAVRLRVARFSDHPDYDPAWTPGGEH